MFDASKLDYRLSLFTLNKIQKCRNSGNSTIVDAIRWVWPLPSNSGKKKVYSDSLLKLYFWKKVTVTGKGPHPNYSTVWAATGLLSYKTVDSTGASLELVCCQKVEDWATELNSLFSDKPSMSLVEAFGTRWLIWWGGFWDVLDFGDFFLGIRIYHGMKITMVSPPCSSNHDELKLTAWMITFPMKNDEQRVARRRVFSTNQLFLKGLERGYTKKTALNYKEHVVMVWIGWREGWDDGTPVTIVAEGFFRSYQPLSFSQTSYWCIEVIQRIQVALSTRSITSNLVIILNNRTFWTSQLSSLWINFTQMSSCRTSSRCRFCRPFCDLKH